MWLYLITIVAAIFGGAAAFMGLGPVAIVFLVLAVALVAGRVFIGGKQRGGATDPGTPQHAVGGTMSSTGGRGPGGDAGPQDSNHADKAHIKAGFAHEGQAHMVPEKR